MNIKIPHIFHKWTKWETIDQGEIRRDRNNALVGTYEVQRRSCSECGKSKMRIVRQRVA